jgi:tyrosine-protein kinase Etk/Wzc
MGAFANSSPMRRAKTRRVIFAVLIAISLVFTFFPERYRAAVSVAPTDPGSLGLGSALGQLGALNTVFGSQTAVEVALKVGRSVHTRKEMIRRLGLMKRLNFANEIEASRWLEEAVELRSVRGGIIVIECLNRDQKLASDLVGTLQDILREQLAEIAVRQTSYKREIMLKLVADANTQLAAAQTNYNQFRLTTRYSDPSFAIGAIGQRIPVLQAAIKAKEVELSAARQFATDDNMAVRQIIAQIDSLKKQLAQFQGLNPEESDSIGRVVNQSTEAERLERDLEMAKRLYYNYRLLLEGTSVEDLTSSANLRIIERPFIDTGRQINLKALILAALLLILALGIEFYKLRPPVGDAREEP